MPELDADLLRVLDHDRDPIVVIDDELRFTHLNPAAAAKLSLTRESLRGQALWEAFPTLRGTPFERLLFDVRASRVETKFDHTALSGNVWEIGIVPLARGVVLRGRDVTVERHARTIKSAPIEIAKRSAGHELEAIGGLAGGIAHDFNNFLSVIFSYCGIVAEELSRRDPLYPYFQEIQAAAGRANDLTRQLLAFSRQQVLRPRTCDLDALVAEVTKMLQRLLGERIELSAQPHAALWKVRVDPGQIEQVVMNLIVHAREALPGGGHIAITTDNVVIDAGDARTSVLPPGDYVRLCVADDGPGMDEASVARVFEPFFSTKQQGKGTGLGLATAFGIVRQSGGDLHVESALRRGTSFVIHLPRYTAEVVERPRGLEPSGDPTHAPRGTETILLVEDEETVRRATATILRRYGYRVLDAGAGEEALRIVRAQAEKIALLITDVVMPRMSGLDLAVRLRAERPTMKVLLMSGYMDDAYARDGLLGPGVEFLPKPIAPSTLARMVREVLES